MGWIALVRAAAIAAALAGIAACSADAAVDGSADGSSGSPRAAETTNEAGGAAPSGGEGGDVELHCGGGKPEKCAVGERCGASSDCASGACSYAKKCVDTPSCIAHHGGDTCGAGETGEPGAKHESCCTTIAIADGPEGAFVIDKYEVTAGRMRVFLEQTKGNVRGFVESAKPKGWDAEWSEQLPSNMTEALYELGPGGKKGCDVLNQGGRTYDQPPIDGNAGEKSDFSQDVLDEKSLNCVSWYMGAAFCAFDGKRLVTSSEMRHVFTNGGADEYPWSGTDPKSGVINHSYNYQTPRPPASMRLVGSGEEAYPLDHAFYVSPPGRFPAGASKSGVEDAAGNTLPWVADGPREFIWTHSWENHKGNLEVDTSSGYYTIGIRCAQD